MKKLNYFFMILLTFNILTVKSQSFQKAFGQNPPNQQELYDLSIDNNNNIYTTGTIRSGSLFRNLNFFGTVSKLDENGNLLWQKAYFPSDAEDFDSFFIKNIFKLDSTNTYCFGSLLASNSGFYLLKLDNDGQVLWAKFVNDEAELILDVAYTSDFIYTIFRDKIVKFDLNGNVINAVKINLGFDVTLRKIIILSSGNIVVTGDLLYNSNWNTPVITFNQNLELVSGFLYYRNDFNATYGTALAETTNNNLIIGLSDQSLFCINQTGTIQWAKTFIANETDTSIDAIDSIDDIQRLNENNTLFYLAMNGTYFDETTNLAYIALGKLDNLGNISELKAIKQTPFNAVDNYSVVTSLYINPTSNNYLLSGGLNAYGATTTLSYNYLHKSYTNQLGCGEETIAFNVENSMNSLNTITFPNDLVVPTIITTIPKTITVMDIPVEYNNTYCISLLSTQNISMPTVTIAPNPAINHIEIQTDNNVVSVVIYDMLGKKIIQEDSKNVDISALKSGVYLIKVIDNFDNILNSKFIKK